MEWNALLYDNKHDFVAEYGKGLLEFIPNKKSQTILDLGCGTGTLSAKLADFASRVEGIDGSSNMIKKAQLQYPEIKFVVGDALALPYVKEWDIIFSNAVFHWIKDHKKLLQNIHQALKPGGMLICEFGAKGNIATIETAFKTALQEQGYDYQSKFNFPTVGDFKQALLENGFIIDTVYAYKRPTVLKDEQLGLANWMKQFFASELEKLSFEEQTRVLKRVEMLCEAKLKQGNDWFADYCRLRAIAHI